MKFEQIVNARKTAIQGAVISRSSGEFLEGGRRRGLPLFPAIVGAGDLNIAFSSKSHE
jgi:hypothetical protein